MTNQARVKKIAAVAILSVAMACPAFAADRSGLTPHPGHHAVRHMVHQSGFFGAYNRMSPDATAPRTPRNLRSAHGG